MPKRWLRWAVLCTGIWMAGCASLEPARPLIERTGDQAVLVLPLQGGPARTLRLDGLFVETDQGRSPLPADLVVSRKGGRLQATAAVADGRTVTLAVERQGRDFVVRFSSQPETGIVKWGLAAQAAASEHFTGLMERVVDGPQQASWAPGRKEAMDLRGQKVDMILKPTTSVYAPFYLSSGGYATFVKGDWPGHYDFCAADPNRVRIEFEGPRFEMKVYTSADPAAAVQAHAIEAGPPFMPPAWMFSPWRWRDEHRHRSQYYDGTPVAGPFNSEVMEDVLMMKAYGIPCTVYWIDRPWGPGRLGYDDFEIDPNRLPNFGQMVRWLGDQEIRLVLWIGPFFQGKMEQEGLAKGYTLAGQQPQRNNYPLVDFTNPQARAYWQEGVAKLLKQGVAGFKLDRSEEGIPESGPYKVYDGRTIRENRNAYPPMYLKAAYDVSRAYRDRDFVLMPRAAYTGSSAYGVFWGGDIGGTQEGLRASIIAVQRSAVMGYPNWGSDTCGYNQQSLDADMCARWLGFSCFTPIMEVGPTRNLGFWNLPREPSYDSRLIAIWRLYARLHHRLADYSTTQARQASRTGMPIVRPLLLVDPSCGEAWKNWWTYLYGPDLLVSPLWQKGQRTQEVYLPQGQRWQDAWHKGKVYEGGQTVTVEAELHQVPLFVRVGSNVDVGDLEREYAESVAIAQNRPDLTTLDQQVRQWFEKSGGATPGR